MKQMRAQGTALFIAMTPIWIGPLLPYWRAGPGELETWAWCWVQWLAVGGYFGAQWAQTLPVPVLRRCFAAVLMMVALRMFFQR